MSKHENGMKRIALHIRACDSGIQKSKVKRSVVTNKNRAAAVVSMYRVANLAEYATERVLLWQRRAQRMKGVDTGDRQRRWVEAAPSKGLT